MNLNRVMIAGNLTRDVAIKFLAGDKAIGEFGVAINRKWKDANGQQKEEVTFVDVEAWGRTAELCAQYLAKGRGCFIEGRLKLEQWEDKKDGSKRSKLKVVAENVQFIGGREHGGERQAEPKAEPQRQESAPSGGGSDSEPPFNRKGEWE
jgi:single-strand DNA-binding protein